MAIRDFVAKVRIAFDSSAFKDGLSGAQKAYHDAFADMTAATESFQSRGSMAMQSATQLSLIASSTQAYRERIQAALAEPVEAASSLESSLAAVSTVITPELAIDGDYQKTLDELKAKALDWGSGTAEGSRLATASADEFASTTYSMLSAGLDAEAAMEATAKSYILAKGTMGEATEAANLLAMAYNTMGDKGKDSGDELQRLSDVIAKTQAAFQISNLGQLSEGLKYAIPTAQKYKMEWEEISTLIGQLNTSGLTGSMAGTSFASMMAQMLKASGSLGFDIAYDETGAMSVIGTLENIRAKFGDIESMSSKVQMAFDTAFGQEGSRALTLLLSSLDTLSASYEAVSDSEGQAEMMAARMSDTYEDQTERMNNARASFQAKLGTSAVRIKGSFAGIRTSFYNMASAFLDTKVGSAIGGFTSSVMVAGSGVLGLGGTALNVAAQLATFVAMTQQAGGVLNLLKAGGGMVSTVFSVIGSGAVGAGRKVFTTVIGIVPKVVSGAKAIGVAFYAATGPVGVVIAVIAAVGAAAFLVYKNWDKIRDFFKGLWTNVSEIFSSAFSWISDKVSAFVNTVTKPFKWLADKIGGLLGWKNEDLGGDFEADATLNRTVTETFIPETTETPELDFAIDTSYVTDAISTAMEDASAKFDTTLETDPYVAAWGQGGYDYSWAIPETDAASSNDLYVSSFVTEGRSGYDWNLPETVTAEVNAYSWPQPEMADSAVSPEMYVSVENGGYDGRTPEFTASPADELYASSWQKTGTDETAFPQVKLVTAGTGQNNTEANIYEFPVNSYSENPVYASGGEYSYTWNGYEERLTMPDGESGSLLSQIRDYIADLIAIVKARKGGNINIQNLNLPETDDIRDVIRFVDDLKEQLEREVS